MSSIFPVLSCCSCLFSKVIGYLKNVDFYKIASGKIIHNQALPREKPGDGSWKFVATLYSYYACNKLYYSYMLIRTIIIYILELLSFIP